MRKYAILLVSAFLPILPTRADVPLDGDVILSQLVFVDGFYDHSGTVFLHAPATDGFLFWKHSTNMPSVSVFGPTLAYNSGGNTIDVTPATTSTAGSLSAADKTKLDGLTAPVSLSFNNSASHAPVVTTASTGFLLSSTRAAHVSYNGILSTTATIGGASTATAFLEICTTNSTTPGDWIMVQSTPSSQTITLAIALQSVQGVPATLSAIVPAGYYCRVRVSGTGTWSASANFTGQEVLTQ